MGPTGLDVAGNLARVRERIEAARARAGRRDPVTLVAVTKTVPLSAVAAACAAGQRDLGENRLQEALARQAELPPLLVAAGLPPDLPRWHCIGHIQGNKARLAAGAFALLHAVDSWPLAQRLDAAAAARGARQAILLEVNLTREAQKFGAAPAEVADLAARLPTLPHLELQGLMAMARFDAEPAELHATFAGLRRLAEEARRASGLALPHLSMGMSADFEIAVEEGATLVRVGTAIFGERG